MSEVELIDIFAGNLESMIREVGISQRELAKESNLYEGTISRYLSGQRLPTVKALVNLCYALNCETNDLLPTYELIS